MQVQKQKFLFLQGPHGPFFARLGDVLADAGAQVFRVGFNAGDRVFSPQRAQYIPFTDAPDAWPARCEAILRDHDITDLVLYGDTRPMHAQALALAQKRGLRCHVFEEGYLRPYWITYERGGSNGHSRLMELPLPAILDAVSNAPDDEPEAPAIWGDMREHIYYGALYHWFVMFMNAGYPRFRSHRRPSLWQETRDYSAQLLTLPWNAAQRARTHRQIRASGRPYHMVLLQLEHDANFLAHGPFDSNRSFAREIITQFAQFAPAHHLLIFKAHPLEPRPIAQRRIIQALAKEAAVADRVRYVRGGKLATLLDHARSALTVTSTAAHQALWRGIPTRSFGDSIYARPSLTSDQPLESFFAAPQPPDRTAYRAFRQFLLRTSQIPGGFYSSRGRAQLLRAITDKMLDPRDPYDAMLESRPWPPRNATAMRLLK